MIFLHLLLGLIFGKIFSHTLLFVTASILPDIDHLYLIVKHRLFTKKRIFNILKYEDRYNIRFKTPLIHSILGLSLCTILCFIITQSSYLTSWFAIMYASHLLIDWPDTDIKKYLFPFKKEFKGFLPIWSKPEKVITLIAFLILVMLYQT